MTAAVSRIRGERAGGLRTIVQLVVLTDRLAARFGASRERLMPMRWSYPFPFPAWGSGGTGTRSREADADVASW
jgi:hypothetical protein